ncbi:hypothetical protein OIU84_006176 [Salix udensis]|uniref:Uncharacterized protein n=1 Tax=Salix udensis TaxID=889485 RepID=A0AAD6JXU6_9ROSI|nr:hypothetical protein OIU84_006176 [Salix udensis]
MALFPLYINTRRNEMKGDSSIQGQCGEHVRQCGLSFELRCLVTYLANKVPVEKIMSATAVNKLNKEHRLQALRASLPTLTLAGARLSAIIESYSLNSDAYVRNLLDSSNTKWPDSTSGWLTGMTHVAANNLLVLTVV